MNGDHLEEEEEKEDLEICECRSNSGNEREGNEQHGIGRQRRIVKKNKTLGTERRVRHPPDSCLQISM